MDATQALVEVFEWQKGVTDRGKPYTGINAQSTRSTDLFAAAWGGVIDGKPVLYSVGDVGAPWSLQSVSKT